MSWRTIDSADVLRELLTHPVVGIRMVGLDAPSDALADVLLPSSGSCEEHIAAWRDIPFGRRFELSVMDTDPASVVVYDGTSRKIIGAYVWTGAGGRIPSSRDTRVIQLADALEADHRGQPNPVVSWLEPDLVAEAEAPAFSVEEELGDGVRGSIDDMSLERLFAMVESHCTDQQVRVFERLVGKKKHIPRGLLNVRVAGGAAIQQVCPVLEDRFGQQWLVQPTGVLISAE